MADTVFSVFFVVLAVNFSWHGLANGARPLDIWTDILVTPYEVSHTIRPEIPLDKPLMRYKRQGIWNSDYFSRDERYYDKYGGRFISDDYIPLLYPTNLKYKPPHVNHGARIFNAQAGGLLKSMILGTGIKQGPKNTYRVHVRDRPRMMGYYPN